MKTRVVLGISVVAFLVAGFIATAQQPKRKSATPSASETSGLSEEDKLRMQLQFDPQNADAHKELVELLKKKSVFRAIVSEDTTWLNNNRSDSSALLEIVSFACDELDDPEYAIAQLRLQLSAVPRLDDPQSYDSWSDMLATNLEERGRPQEALPLRSKLVRLNPNEAGSWADYGHVLSLLGKKDEAAKAFRRSIDLPSDGIWRIAPQMESFHEGFAEVLLKAGDLSGAESEYRASLSWLRAAFGTGGNEPTDSYLTNQHDTRRAVSEGSKLIRGVIKSWEPPPSSPNAHHGVATEIPLASSGNRCCRQSAHLLKCDSMAATINVTTKYGDWRQSLRYTPVPPVIRNIHETHSVCIGSASAEPSLWPKCFGQLEPEGKSHYRLRSTQS